jgi:ribosomal protein S18 acetylase RimI-like enzyme
VTRDLSIAPLTPSHRDQIEAILRATGVFSEQEIAVGLELFDAGTEDDYEFLGAFHADRLIGYACFGPTPSTEGTYDLYWIAVDPKSQGMGAGRALMDAVERLLMERNARLVVVETSSKPSYEPTRRFYERLGYAIAARLRNFYAPGDDRLVLTKRLRFIMTAGAATM